MRISRAAKRYSKASLEFAIEKNVSKNTPPQADAKLVKTASKTLNIGPWGPWAGGSRGS